MAVVSGDSDGVVVGILGYSALEAERKRARSQNMEAESKYRK